MARGVEQEPEPQQRRGPLAADATLVKSASTRRSHDSSLTSASLTTLCSDSSSLLPLADTAPPSPEVHHPSCAAPHPLKSDKPGPPPPAQRWTARGGATGAAGAAQCSSPRGGTMQARQARPGAAQAKRCCRWGGVVRGAGQEVQPLVAAEEQDYARGAHSCSRCSRAGSSKLPQGNREGSPTRGFAGSDSFAQTSTVSA
jgi:hypothetical protein